LPQCVFGLQDLRDMVAYEQEHNAGSRSFGSCPRAPPSVQSICWELHSFLKLHGRTGALVLHWFKAALEQLLPLLAPLDAGEPAIEHTRNAVALLQLKQRHTGRVCSAW
jgi:hypothetical protein